VLLWSPGAEDNPLHPGDDAKAAEVLAESRRWRDGDCKADADFADLIGALAAATS
jgi:hypothetical protein